jgi:LL-diaminopimelate aminotransferase
MNPRHEFSDRIKGLPAYIFSEINLIKADAQRRGIQLLSLGIGDPDQPTPEAIVKKMQEAIARPENHLYSPYEGTAEFRRAVQGWMKRRFAVELDADKEIVALIGSKEGLAHFPLAFLNPGDKAMFPSPGYPVFQTSILMAGAEAIPLPLLPENGFLPDLNKMEEAFRVHRPKYCLLNFPSNPTSVMCSKAMLSEIVNLAIRYNVILGYDNAYAEIYRDPQSRPCSILEIPGAKDIAVEFHSLSKTFNMTGWRIAYAVGNAQLLAGLLKVKTNIDSGPLPAVQQVGAYALGRADELTEPIRQLYAARIDRALTGLRRMGIEYIDPKATFFVWAKTPKNMASMDLTRQLIETQGLVVTPGMGFGAEGEGFFRLSLTVPDAQIDEALNRLERFLKS